MFLNIFFAQPLHTSGYNEIPEDQLGYRLQRTTGYFTIAGHTTHAMFFENALH